MGSGEPPYRESLSFLLSQLGARAAELFADRLHPFGISPRAYGVLSNAAADGSRTQQQLADTLGIHRNNMVGLIDELEAAGWVQRHRSPNDRRAFEVRLTPPGSALLSRVSTMLPSLETEIADGLTIAERQTLLALLMRLAEALNLAPGVHPYLGTPRG
ncbi:MAG TPA: MarR family winged helix-turn-helix transcriptional regulator [Acidothermaceae bacterium]